MNADAATEILQRLNTVLRGQDRWKLYVPQFVDRPLDLSPWVSWLYLCLVRHRTRQQFVLDSMKLRLNGDPTVIAAAGALGHPEGSRFGLVPGDSNWEYRFHGRGCCMTHRLTGEEIDVDFFDETADWFTPYFFINYLDSLKKPSFIEKRICQLYSSRRCVLIGIDELKELGLIESGEYSEFRLRGPIEELTSVLDAIGKQWEFRGVQALFSAALSDWQMLSEIDGTYCAEADSLLATKSEQLSDAFHSGKNAAEALLLLADLGSPQLDSCIRHVLSGPPCGALSAALEVIEQRNVIHDWKTSLLALIDRIDPNEQPPSPYIWVRTAKLLCSIEETDSVAPGFEVIQSSSLSEAAFLAMELQHPVAMKLIRRSLRSHIPINRIEMAAALAVIDLPWSRNELAVALSESDDQEMTTDLRSALCESHDTEVQAIVTDWESRNPHEPSSDPFPTIGELAQQRNDSRIQYEMQSLHDRIIPLRTSFKPPADS